MAKVCSEAGCPNFAAPNGRGKCLEHRRQYERERSARRRAATKGVYKKKRWQTTRAKVLARDPICKSCGERLSQEVDHITPLDQDSSRPYALDGLQGLCSECHRDKTARENAGKGRVET
jgi:5-methylcytosine-specific restriction endonuclease McrA